MTVLEFIDKALRFEIYRHQLEPQILVHPHVIMTGTKKQMEFFVRLANDLDNVFSLYIQESDEKDGEFWVYMNHRCDLSSTWEKYRKVYPETSF